MKIAIGLRDKILLAVWLAVNIVDSLTTYVFLSLGGKEILLPIYRATHSMLLTAVGKYCAVVLIPLILMKTVGLRWLVWCIIVLLLVVAWNIWYIIFLL